MNLAAAYCRVSTKNQQDSIKDQQEQWDEIINKEGFTFANCGVFYKKNGEKESRNGLYVDEGISAKEYRKHREAFKQMIEDAKAGKFKKIFVEDTTRFARNVEDGMGTIKDLREKGVGVIFRKEGLDSIDVKNDMVLGVLFSVAEQEIKTDSARFKWRIDKLHRAGKWTSPAPFGYKIENGVLSINEEEVETVRFVYKLYTKSMLGMRGIGNILNENGSRTRGGNLWKATTIRYMLVNKIYIGDLVTHKTESYDITRGTHKNIPSEEQIKIHNENLRIISDEEWNIKESIMEKRNEKLKNREGYSTKHLLSSILYCEECGSTYIRVKRKKAKNETGEKVDRGYEWTCLGHNHYGNIKCKGRYTLKEDELIDFIIKELKKQQKRDLSGILELYREKKTEEKKKINIKELLEIKEEINIQIIQLRAEKNKKLIDEITYEEQLGQMNKKLSDIRTLENKYNNIKIDLEKMETKYAEYCNMLKNINFNKLTNATLKKIFNKIKVRGVTENGHKYIYLHFSYNFLDDTQTELLRENIDGESSICEVYLPYKIEKLRNSIINN